MTDKPQPEKSLEEEFRRLGKNLADVLRAAWESPERKNVQQEIEDGLNQLSNTLQKEVEEFQESPTGQRLKSDVEEVSQRIRSSETQSKVREEILTALRSMNEELRKTASRWSQEETGSADSAPSSQEDTNG